MLEKEVIKRSFLDDQITINVDDFSTNYDISKAETVCKKNNIYFLKNKKKGVQNAIQTAIDWMNIEGKKVDWILVLQHDIFPGNKDFYKKLNNTLKNSNLNKVGLLGFNVVGDENDWATNNSLEDFLNNKKPNGYLGVPFLCDTKIEYKRVRKSSYIIFLILKLLNKTYFRKYNFVKRINEKYRIHSNAKRDFCPTQFKDFDKFVNKFPTLFTIDLPVWAGVAINVDAWEKVIKPCDELQFMHWAPDVAMQFLVNNYHSAVSRDLYLINDQKCKEKYGFWRSSPDKNVLLDPSKNQLDETNLFDKVFKERWGFSYGNVKNEYPKLSERYRNTLVEKYFNHDIRNGPLINLSID
tara:strand:+ start:361 stop:1419 length:1059 start_codon:yes stop_codon:yes gene_type:complete